MVFVSYPHYPVILHFAIFSLSYFECHFIHSAEFFSSFAVVVASLIIFTFHKAYCQQIGMMIISFCLASYPVNVISYHIISYHIISCHVMSCHVIISYHISHHIISYHIISYIIYHISYIIYHISYIIYHIIYHIIYSIMYHIQICEKSVGTTELQYSTKKRYHVLDILKSFFSSDTR